VSLDDDGVASFRPIRTDSLRVRLDRGDGAVSLGFDSSATNLGYGISELRLGGADFLPLHLSDTPVVRPCGTGPTIRVNGVARRTGLVASAAELAAGAVVEARLCGVGAAAASPATQEAVALHAGTNDIDVLAATGAAVPVSLVLTPSGRPPAAVPTATPLPVTGGAVTRVLDPAPGSSVVVLRENVNAGWRASQDGRRLTPLTVDGWQQGFLLRGEGPVTVDFTPDAHYRLGLGAGLLAALALVGVVLVGARRTRPDPRPPLAERSVPLPVTALVLVVAGGLLAGAAGVAMAAAAIVAGAVLATRPGWLSAMATTAAAAAAAACVVAGLAFAVRPWGRLEGWAGDQPWVTYVLLVPLFATLLSWDVRRRKRGGRFFSASAGRSTSR
jgi:arabinofuranan 3-O-arabinosyltransferase